MTAQERIASLSTPVWELAALAAAVESGLVAALDEPREVGELGERAGLPVAVAAALLDVLAAMELAEREGDRWVASAELEPATRGPRLGALRDDLCARRCCRRTPSSPRRATTPMRSGVGATATRTCCRRRAGCRRA